MHLKTLAALLLGALLVLTGCGATAEGEGLPASAASAGPSGSTGSTGGSSSRSMVSPELEFTAEALDGSTFDGTELAGKPAVLWFWAPWCPTCLAQASGVSGLAGKYDGVVNVVGVGGLSDVAAIRDFAEMVPGPTHLIDEEGAVWRHFGVTAQSTYVVLDADGAVVADGYLDDAALARKVAELAS